jgi:hypothetical protein
MTAAVGRTVNLDMPLASVLLDPAKDWDRLTLGRNRTAGARNIKVDWNTFTQDQFLFSHCSIVASVKAEADCFRIDPVCSPLVNKNGNAWTNPVLLATFRSFIGGENYVEHIQVPELSKGKLLDAVIRPVTYHNEKLKKDADVYFVDILVATNRKHGKLCKRIATGELNTLSMGCLADWVQCSRCGVMLKDGEENCEHIDHQLLSTYIDDDGVERVVAELCGRCIPDKDGNLVGDPESCKFIEASWVEKPAFEGAVLNHLLSELPKAAHILEFSSSRLEETVEQMFRMRVADTHGMVTLRVAMYELMRRRRMAMAERVANSIRSR